VIEFVGAADMDGVAMPPPREFLAATQRDGRSLLAVKFYETTRTGSMKTAACTLVPAQLIEQYAMSVSPLDPVRRIYHRVWLLGQAPHHR
jgi:hypothetical protein